MSSGTSCSHLRTRIAIIAITRDFENTVGVGRGRVWACVLQSRSSNTKYCLQTHLFPLCTVSVKWWEGTEGHKRLNHDNLDSFFWVKCTGNPFGECAKWHTQWIGAPVTKWPQPTRCVKADWGLGHMRRLLIKYQPSGHSAVDTATISQGHLQTSKLRWQEN